MSSSPGSLSVPHEVTRFAPSPTGPLHLGHAYAGLVAAAAAGPGGRFLLRIEDLDAGRARADYETALLEDLAWLGLSWEAPVMRQSARSAAYGAAVSRLEGLGLVYPCFCTRKDIQAQIEASASAPHGPPPQGPPHGPDGPLYPGLCRDLSETERAARRAAGQDAALRLNLRKALTRVAGPLAFEELGQGPEGECGHIPAQPELFGDIVLVRKEAPASYHLAVVVDDAAQGVTLVTRGRDLFAATHIHRLLQALLDLPVPRYLHHDLVTDEAGRRLAKRDNARALAALRAEGLTPKAVLERLPPLPARVCGAPTCTKPVHAAG